MSCQLLNNKPNKWMSKCTENANQKNAHIIRVMWVCVSVYGVRLQCHESGEQFHFENSMKTYDTDTNIRSLFYIWLQLHFIFSLSVVAKMLCSITSMFDALSDICITHFPPFFHDEICYSRFVKFKRASMIWKLNDNSVLSEKNYTWVF